MVFYFTGTGNSLYIAKQLDDEPISIPQVIHQKDLEFTSDKIGIVAPIYGHEVPEMVKDFLNKACFHTEYFYMILTYGNRHGGAAELAKQLCDSCGIAVQYINVIRMVDNWLPGFDMEKQRRLDKNIDGQLTVILRDIKEEKCMISEVTEKDRRRAGDRAARQEHHRRGRQDYRREHDPAGQEPAEHHDPRREVRRNLFK